MSLEILSSYQINIGSGGQGSVYMVMDGRLGQEVNKSFEFLVALLSAKVQNLSNVALINKLWGKK